MMTRTLITYGSLLVLGFPLSNLPQSANVQTILNLSAFSLLGNLLSPTQAFLRATPSPSPSPDCDPVNNPSDCQSS